jgi:hypothetical protein
MLARVNKAVSQQLVWLQVSADGCTLSQLLGRSASADDISWPHLFGLTVCMQVGGTGAH